MGPSVLLRFDLDKAIRSVGTEHAGVTPLDGISGQIEAELAVGLVGGLVDVPLMISGPVDKVRVSVTASTLAGAAAGTAVLPGVGTAVGAQIGLAIGKLLGSRPAASQGAAPAAN